MRNISSGACVVLLAVLGASAVGCGSSAKVETNSRSVGQQLEDLEAAHDKGLLTDDEYQKQRQKILKGS